MFQLFRQINRVPLLFGLCAAVPYGIFAHVAFNNPNWEAFFGALTIAFIFLLPITLGALTVYFAPTRMRSSGRYAFFAPWLTVIAVCTVLAILEWEALICLVMAMPIFCLMASVGGVIMWSIRKNKQSRTLVLLLALGLPYFTAPVEAQFDAPRQLTTTHTEIRINANPDTVWQAIKSVPAIGTAEHSPNALHLIGLPRPVAATLSHDGVGGVRTATFEGGLQFDETVTDWVVNERIRFTIVETSEDLLPPPLNMIGTETFDVIYGEYRIEPQTDGTVILHLDSEHYLTTRFNQYGVFWTDLIMRNLQDYILKIIQQRVETGTAIVR